MADICTFVGINILMGMKRLPSINRYWSGDALVSVHVSILLRYSYV